MALLVQHFSLHPPPAENSCLLSSSSQAFLSSACWRAKRSSSKQTSAHGVPRGGSARATHSGKVVTSNESSDGLSPELSSFDRRQLLLGSTTLGVAGLPSLWLPNEARSAPVPPPEYTKCTSPIDPGNGAPEVNCCLPTSQTVTDFTFPINLPMRTRPSAHKVGANYIAKYRLAYERLRALPSSDPRTYTLQANVHCAFCDGAYDQKDTDLEYQVHNSWFFYPWHRWYLYFHERILASLIDDDTFALPFWNWDSASGYTMPPMFVVESTSLYDTNRNPGHMPPTVVDLNYSKGKESGLSPAEQLEANNAVMYRQVVTGAKTPTLFFGSPYRQGDEPSPGGGTIENSPHGTVHVWTGNPSNPNNENMGSLYSAARDPIFFSHHSNVDRLWVIWKSLGGRRKDFTDPDYLNATFTFYDENAKLVRVKAGDALETTKLAYKYEDVPISWLKAKPSSSKTASSVGASIGKSTAGRILGGVVGLVPGVVGEVEKKVKEKVKTFKRGLKEFKDIGLKALLQPVRGLVKRPKKVRADDDEEEILVLKGVELPTDEQVKFDVYINLADEGDEEKVGADVSEFVGSFVNVPHLGMKMGGDKRIRKGDFRLGIGDVLKELDIEDDDDFAITIVPRGKTSVPITVQSVTLEYA